MAWVLAAVLLLGLTGCRQEEIQPLTMGTGSKTGSYYGYGGVLGQQIQDATGIPVRAVETEGSKANIQGMASGEFQLGIMQSDTLGYAWQGRRDFDGARVDTLRAIAGLYTEPIQLVSVNPEIRYADELRGLRIAVGLPGSGTYFNALDVLDAVSLRLDDIQPQYLSLEDTIKALEEGTVDAAFLMEGTPTPALQALSGKVDFALIPIEGPIAERILTSCSFYTVHTIPAGTYPNQREKVNTLAVRATLVVAADQPVQTVYDMTKAIFENLDSIRSCNPKGKDMDLERLAEGVPIPFHAGAKKYFDQNDIYLR